jgi:hypothetical protein
MSAARRNWTRRLYWVGVTMKPARIVLVVVADAEWAWRRAYPFSAIVGVRRCGDARVLSDHQPAPHPNGRFTPPSTCEILSLMQHQVKVQWWKLYVVASLAFAVIGLTTGQSDSSVAWHIGTIIVIAGILALWRLSRPWH